MAAVPALTFTPVRGVVAAFDDHVGAGTVAAADGATWWFHCTRIADGSRSIAAGTDVWFTLAPGPTGFEAVAVTPLQAAGA